MMDKILNLKDKMLSEEAKEQYALRELENKLSEFLHYVEFNEFNLYKEEIQNITKEIDDLYSFMKQNTLDPLEAS